MRRRALLLMAVLAVAPVASGCLSLFPNDKEPREVMGPTRGYSATPTYLKVHVETNDSRLVMVDFDRREWHVSELARRLDGRQIQFLYAEGMPREIINEILVQQVLDPDDVGSLRFESMDASDEERLRLDAEYDALLARLGPDNYVPLDGSAPGLPEEAGERLAPLREKDRTLSPLS